VAYLACGGGAVIRNRRSRGGGLRGFPQIVDFRSLGCRRFSRRHVFHAAPFRIRSIAPVNYFFWPPFDGNLAEKFGHKIFVDDFLCRRFDKGASVFRISVSLLPTTSRFAVVCIKTRRIPAAFERFALTQVTLATVWEARLNSNPPGKLLPLGIGLGPGTRAKEFAERKDRDRM
jgi:hypothetical protein